MCYNHREVIKMKKISAEITVNDYKIKEKGVLEENILKLKDKNTSLFFDLKITFESLFIVLPIDKTINMYPLYHEMDYLQTLEFVKNKIKYSVLDEIMTFKSLSTQKLSRLSGVSFSTISALRYGKRDINKLEASSLLKLANALRVKVESLLTDINLIFGK